MTSTLKTLTKQQFEDDKVPKTTNIIKDMLTENTGRHLLDSGSHYGRNFEENQNKDFEDEPVATHEIEEWDGEINILTSVSTFHYLKHRLEFDKESLSLTKQFYDRATSEELEDDSWLSCMKACFGGASVNTYNMEFHNTDQILQFVAFTLEYVGYAEERDPRPEDREFVLNDRIVKAVEDIYGEYVALQIHGGCDVRGGYTAPVVFKAPHGTDYLMMEVTSNVNCPNCGWVGSQYETINEGAWDEIEKVDEHEETGLTELVHKKCGCKLDVNAFVGV